MRRCLKRPALAWLIVVAAAAPAAAQHDMQVFNTRFYRIVTNLSADDARPIARHMDQVFSEYTRRLARAGFRQRGASEMNLYLIDTQANYVRLLAEKGINGIGSGGMFFVRGDEAGLATFVAGQGRTRMLATLQHEAFHQFAYLRIGTNLPIWANEGLAEYFGDALLVRGRFRPGMVDRRRLANVQQAVAHDKAFGFGELLNMTGQEWVGRVNRREGNVALMYDQAWSMVHFLVHARRGRFEPAFMNYLYQIHRGRTSAQAFEQAFQTTDYQPFEDAWREYIVDLEPDPLTTAIERLSFMAEGVKHLDDSARSFASIEQLQNAMRDANFTYRIAAHGIRVTMSADDPNNFAPPQPIRRHANTRWTIDPTSDPNLPPAIALTGLTTRPSLKWFHDDQNNLSYDVVFE